MNDIATELAKLRELAGADFSRQVELIANMRVFHLDSTQIAKTFVLTLQTLNTFSEICKFFPSFLLISQILFLHLTFHQQHISLIKLEN
jgi:hypothetical protein